MVRYNLDNVHDLLYSYEELKCIQVDKDFILQLLKAFEDEKNFFAHEFNCFSLDVIVDYIRRTHKYYLTKKLPEIEQSIQLLSQDYSDKHPLLAILLRFYSAYKADLSEHIGKAEHVLLPYICYLQRCDANSLDAKEFFVRTKYYSLQNFVKGHHNTEDDLLAIRNAILEYNPPATNKTPYRILLSQLQVFEKDLAVHALIEDQVLITRALELEKKLSDVFLKRVKLN